LAQPAAVLTQMCDQLGKELIFILMIKRREIGRQSLCRR
jgi:hypothetical protein